MSGAVVRFPEYLRPSVAGFVPVSVRALRWAGHLPCGLYFPAAAGGKAVLYRAADYVPPATAYEELSKNGTCWLFVRDCEAATYLEWLDANLEPIIGEPRIPAPERLEVLHRASRGRYLAAFRLENPACAIDLAVDLGRKLAAIIRSATVHPADVVDLFRCERGTFAHSFNVSIYAILLAQRLGIDADELPAIGTGGLLHDLGKRRLPAALLESSRSLGREEKELVRTHPQRGFEELHSRQDLTWPQRMMVYQHHERMDGSGYPVRIVGDEIHPYARLCAVADVFDALTARRAYRRSEDPYSALGRLQELGGRRLDPEMVQCWTTCLQNNSSD